MPCGLTAAGRRAGIKKKGPMPEITVWTKQNRAVLDQLESNGRFIADERFIRRELEDTADIMLFIYSWLAAHMPAAADRPADAKFPVWVSYEKEATMSPEPGYAVLELRVPAELVTRLDIAKWTRITNYSYIPADEEDDKKDDEDDFSANTETEGAINNASQSIVQDEKDEQMGASAASASATALSDGEKAELENYRREEKQRMISEYKGDLSDEILENFKNNIDSFTKEELEAKLAIEFRKFKKSVNDETNKTITAFSILTSANNSSYDETNAADVINKYAKKK
jgi:hypothetical protein